MRCQKCNHENRSGARFCDECGAQLPSAGERRQLTVMFCDIVDSTGLSQRVDPEDLQQILSTYKKVCAEGIHRFSGHVAQHLGDGLLVYFGYPQAHEHDAERALRAGLAILESLAGANVRLEADFGEKIAARIGVHSGTMVLGQEGDHPAAFSDTFDTVARLQALAPPDTLVVSGTTLRLVQGLFLIRDLGAADALGDSSGAYQVLRPSGVRSRIDLAAAGGLSPFVAREREMGSLVACWDAVSAEGGKAVLVAGEPGIGKSRLAHQFRQRLAETRHTWLECRGSPYTQDSAFFPVIELQSRGIGFAAEDPGEEKLAKLEAALDRAGFALPEVVPLLAELHSIPLPPTYSIAKLSSEAIRRKTIEVIRDWLLAIGKQQPVVLLVEDLHWVDPSTLALLGSILERLPETRVLMLATYRSGFDPPWPGFGHVSTLALERLEPRAAREMVRGVAGGRTLPDGWIDDIVGRTDGVPLFVEEMTKVMLEGAGGGTESSAAPRPGVPLTLHDLFMARLDRLGPAKEVAALGAVLGREFSSELMRAVWPREEAAVSDALGELVRAELLYQRVEGSDVTYVFKHALVQDTAYDSLLKASRQRYHERIAEVLEERFPEVAQRQPELLAHHFTKARQAQRALPHWLAAGRRGTERSANAEAIRHLGRGLECARSLPPGQQRTGLELELQTLLTANLTASRGYAAREVAESAARAYELCTEIGETPHVLPALFGLWLFHLVRSDRQETRDLAERLFAFADRGGDDSMLMQAHLANALTSFYEGRHENARAHAVEVQRRYSVEAHRAHLAVYGDDPGVYGYVYEALPLWFLGFSDQALARMMKARSLAEEVQHPFTIAGAQAFLTQIRQLRCEVEATAEAAAETIAQSQEQGFPLFVGVGIVHLGWAQMRGGDDGAAARIREGIALFRSTGARLNLPYFLCELAEACLAGGDREGGFSALDEATAAVEANLDGYYEAEIHRLRGELLLLGKDAAAAEASLRRALDVARDQHASSLALRAATSLGRLLRLSGRKEETRALIGETCDTCSAGDSEALQQARAVLASASD
jgi:class 3 adenylate cyclase/predicted ATPase